MKSLMKHVRWLEKEFGTEAKVARAVEANLLWRAKEDLLRSVPGVGRVLATTLLADLPELGQLNQQIAKLVGLAPRSADRLGRADRGPQRALHVANLYTVISRPST